MQVLLLIKQLQAENVDYACCASTNSAAALIGGGTFHAMFELGITYEDRGADRVLRELSTRARQRLLSLHVLLVDEISMLSASAFRIADYMCRCLKKVNTSFGGVRLFVIGDFMQLEGLDAHGQPAVPLFMTEAWEECKFTIVLLNTSKRCVDREWVRCSHKQELCDACILNLLLIHACTAAVADVAGVTIPSRQIAYFVRCFLNVAENSSVRSATQRLSRHSSLPASSACRAGMYARYYML